MRQLTTRHVMWEFPLHQSRVRVYDLPFGTQGRLDGDPGFIQWELRCFWLCYITLWLSHKFPDIRYHIRHGQTLAHVIDTSHQPRTPRYYDIERIIAARRMPSGKLVYTVKWCGYSDKDNTTMAHDFLRLEPGGPKAIADWNARNKAIPGPRSDDRAARHRPKDPAPRPAPRRSPRLHALLALSVFALSSFHATY